MAEGYSYSFIFFYSYTLAGSLLNSLCKHMQIYANTVASENDKTLTELSNLSLRRKVIRLFNVSGAGDNFLSDIYMTLEVVTQRSLFLTFFIFM